MLPLPRLIEDYRLRHNLDEEFDTMVNRNFLANLNRVQIIAFEKFMHVKDIHWDDFRITLNTHRGTVCRWIKGTITPELDTIFQYIAAKNIRVEEIGFLEGRDAVNSAIAKTLVEICHVVKLLRVPTPTIADIEILRLIVCDSRLRERAFYNDRNATFSAMADELGPRYFPNDPRGTDRIEFVLAKWLIPWGLFCSSIQFIWAS